MQEGCMELFRKIIMFLVVVTAFSVGQAYADDLAIPFQSNVFIRNWLICGPFPNENGYNIDTDFLTDKGGEARIKPQPGWQHASISVSSGKVTWKEAEADDSGRLDFKKYLKPNSMNVAYAAAYITCEKRTPVLLKMGSNDRLKVWLNGELVHTFYEPRASEPDADRIPVELKKGENILLAKVDNVGGNWWLYARFEELYSVDEKIYTTAPDVSPVPKRLSHNRIADIFSIMLYNTSAHTVGPVVVQISESKNRQGSTTTCETIQPGQTRWLITESIVHAGGNREKVVADMKIITPSGSRAFHVKQKRVWPPDGTVFLDQGFHVDPIWRDSQSGYQAISFSNVSQYLRSVVADPKFQLYLLEIPYLKPYYDSFPMQRALIRKLIREGRIATGGSYNQPNETTISGEALIRNILYGRLFHENVLGDYPRVYTPWDVFGHIIQLPQILQKSEFIGTTWERSNYRSPFVRVPDVPDLYRAVAPDGSVLFTRKVSYGYDMDARGQEGAAELKVRQSFANGLTEQQQQIPGISYDFRLNATDEKSPTAWLVGRCNIFETFIPRVALLASGAAAYFDSVNVQMHEKALDIPEVSRDVSQYNEGCELSRFDLKLGNRFGENTLLTAEKFATIANALGDHYPARPLDKAWRQLLYGQHHDGITGCGADVPYLDLIAGYHEALELGAQALEGALQFIGKRINTTGGEGAMPLVVFNPLNWQRDDVVAKHIVFSSPVQGFRILDDSGNAVDCVVENVRKQDNRVVAADVVFLARQVPSIGYKTFWIEPASSLPPAMPGTALNTRVVENDFYRITFDENYGGGITSLIEKASGREFINLANGHPGNELILLKEGEGFEPAWRFITTGEKHFSKDEKCDIQIYKNPLFTRIVVTGDMPRLKKRVQEIRLYHHLKRIDFRTMLVDYQGLQGKNILEGENRPRKNDRDFYCIGFPTNLNGAVPVLEDRFATKTYYHSKEYLSYHSTSTEWTSHHAMNSSNQWFDYSYSVKVNFGDKGSIALGPVEILTTHNRSSRQAGFRLQRALAKRGITSTPGYDTVERGYDIQYRRFSFSIGAKGKNSYNEKLIKRLKKSERRVIKNQLKEQGYAYAFVYDPDIKGAWFDLPVLMIIGEDEEAAIKAVDKLVAQLDKGSNINLPSQAYLWPENTRVPDAGLAIINRGNLPVSTEPDGSMILALMHTVPWQSPLLNWTHDFPERKTHVFDYAILPHQSNWQKAGLVRVGYEFNNPLIAVQTEQHSGELPASHSFFTVSSDHAVITALKPRSAGNEAFLHNTATDVSNGIVLRLYETDGKEDRVTLHSAFAIKKAQRVNLMERKPQKLAYMSESISLDLQPYSIETILIKVASEAKDADARIWKEAGPVYGRFWEHNAGAAPLGYLPVNVRIVGNLSFPAAARRPTVVQQVQVAVCNDYTDAPVSGIVRIEAPPGLRAVPEEIHYSVPADSECFYPVAMVMSGSGTRPGFIRASIVHNGQEIFDVLEYGLPAKKFGHADADADKSHRLQWSVEQVGEKVLVHIQNPFSQTIDGEVTLIGPAETWGLVEVNPVALARFEPWRQAFSIVGKGEVTLAFDLYRNEKVPKEDAACWAVAKLSYFGYVDYKEAIGALHIRE